MELDAKNPLGIYAWFGYPLRLDERLKLIKSAGFTRTCLWFGNEEEMVNSGRADEMPALVADYGLILDNIHAPFWNHHLMWTGAKEYLDKARTELRATLQYCGKHRIPIMVAHLGGSGPATVNSPAFILVQELVREAEQLNVIIAAENGEGGLECLDYLFTNINSPNFRFCYDSSHDHIADKYKDQALQKWGHLLVMTHLSDNFGISDDHLIPGYGNINWDTVKAAFPHNYPGTLMLEVDGPESTKGYQPEEFLKAAYDWAVIFSNKGRK
jgi:sugar phosphate isomerase/epimerase